MESVMDYKPSKRPRKQARRRDAKTLTLAELVDKIRSRSARDDSGCLIWTGAQNGRGYGRAWTGHRAVYTHRAMYEHAFGPIPPDMQIDHLCRNRLCCEPSHLEMVTNQENTIRGVGPSKLSARYAARTHCKWGHEMTEENTYCVKGTNFRQCRTCNRINNKRNKAAARKRKRAASEPSQNPAPR